MDGLSPLDRLIAIEDIKAMRASFARAVDTKDWDYFQTLWTPDAILEIGEESRPGPKSLVGPEAITARLRVSLAPDVISVHHALAPEIDVRTPTFATGIWAMEDNLTFPESSPYVSMHGFGHYNEEYEKLGGRWLVKRFRLSRLRVDLVHR